MVTPIFLQMSRFWFSLWLNKCSSFDCYYTVDFSPTFFLCFCVNWQYFPLFLILCWKARSPLNYLFEHSLFFVEIICVLLKALFPQGLHSSKGTWSSFCCFCAFIFISLMQITDFLCKMFFVYHLIVLCSGEEKMGALDCYCDYRVVAMESVSDHINLNQMACLISCLSPWISRTCHLAWGYRLHRILFGDSLCPWRYSFVLNGFLVWVHYSFL